MKCKCVKSMEVHAECWSKNKVFASFDLFYSEFNKGTYSKALEAKDPNCLSFFRNCFSKNLAIEEDIGGTYDILKKLTNTFVYKDLLAIYREHCSKVLIKLFRKRNACLAYQAAGMYVLNRFLFCEELEFDVDSSCGCGADHTNVRQRSKSLGCLVELMQKCSTFPQTLIATLKSTCVRKIAKKEEDHDNFEDKKDETESDNEDED